MRRRAVSQVALADRQRCRGGLPRISTSESGEVVHLLEATALIVGVGGIGFEAGFLTSPLKPPHYPVPATLHVSARSYTPCVT